MPYEIRLTKTALKDLHKLPPKTARKLKEILVKQVSEEPRSGKKLVGDLTGFFSIRLTYKDRIIYSVDEKKKIIYVHRTKTHYGE
ncbi:MAG: type II toxin-antitoxin system RelE/ParE family toxin [Candidatus Omnitrophica bacterium]|nr:type II toxin-antitoxin system RelE/ParE family toxin [Candidatus Omnitrophota bacterium]